MRNRIIGTFVIVAIVFGVFYLGVKYYESFPTYEQMKADMEIKDSLNSENEEMINEMTPDAEIPEWNEKIEWFMTNGILYYVIPDSLIRFNRIVDTKGNVPNYKVGSIVSYAE